MRKLWFSIVLIAAVFLAACTPAARTPAASTTTPGKQPLPTRDSKAVSMQCRVVSSVPTPEPKESELYPPAGPDDWTLGKDTAAMTIVEYSDFQ